MKCDFSLEGFGKYRVVGFSADNNIHSSLDVVIPSDPGYSATAIMVGECAKLLARGEAVRCGVLTPASAFEEKIVNELRHYGFKFDF